VVLSVYVGGELRCHCMLGKDTTFSDIWISRALQLPTGSGFGLRPAGEEACLRPATSWTSPSAPLSTRPSLALRTTASCAVWHEASTIYPGSIRGSGHFPLTRIMSHGHWRERQGRRCKSPEPAAYLLGLTPQVPAQSDYLTDGPSRRVVLGKRVIRSAPCLAQAPDPTRKRCRLCRAGPSPSRSGTCRRRRSDRCSIPACSRQEKACRVSPSGTGLDAADASSDYGRPTC
jgi:hypothetical protein